MQFATPPPTPSEALLLFRAMQKDDLGLKFMLRYLPAGASMEDARRLYERLAQESRTPCRFLDVPLEIRRD